MITLIYNRAKAMVLPQSWEELSHRQVLALAPMLFNGGDELHCKVMAVKILSGLGAFRFRLLHPEVLERALPFVEWVFDRNPFTHQWLPHYKGYYAPASGFDNLRMKEFHAAELEYREVLGGDMNALNNLVAVLYRKPRRWYNRKRDAKGDVRRPFNEHETAYHAARIRKWPDAAKWSVFLWYDSCRAVLIEHNPKVFKEGSSGYESAFDTGLYGLMRTLAGDKLGDVYKVEDMYVHQAMLELGLTIEEDERHEREMKKSG